MVTKKRVNGFFAERVQRLAGPTPLASAGVGTLRES